VSRNLREALNDVVGDSSWRPNNTLVIHDAWKWNTLVGYIVMATNGDNDGQVPMGAQPDCADHYIAGYKAAARAVALDVDALTKALHAEKEAFFGYSAPCSIETCGCRAVAHFVADEYAALALEEPTP
jgi:hypothetical protein